MTIFGVDFSGADAGGAAKIRIACRDLEGGPVVLPPRVGREGLREAILAAAAADRPQLWRIDAPFSLPLETLAAHAVEGGWRAMAEWMRSFGSPRAWRTVLRDRSRREPRRACDLAARTPMAPMNLRLFKQTWTLVCEVLLPVAEAGVRIEPLEVSGGGRVVVAEGCPASVLQQRGWPHRGYKGRGEPPRQRRAELLERLRREDRLGIDASIAEEAIADEEGDLLDAILLVTDPQCGPPPAEARLEGWVY